MLNSVLNKKRYQLYKDYVKELSEISKFVPSSSETHTEICFKHIFRNTTTIWIDIKEEITDILIGFLILNKYPDCHPLTSFFITEAYVVPKYRRKGVMSRVIEEHANKHKEAYSLYILDDNETAKRFWYDTFKRNGYKEMQLTEAGEEKGYKLYGFKPET